MDKFHTKKKAVNKKAVNIRRVGANRIQIYKFAQAMSKSNPEDVCTFEHTKKGKRRIVINDDVAEEGMVVPDPRKPTRYLVLVASKQKKNTHKRLKAISIAKYAILALWKEQNKNKPSVVEYNSHIVSTTKKTIYRLKPKPGTIVGQYDVVLHPGEKKLVPVIITQRKSKSTDNHNTASETCTDLVVYEECDEDDDMPDDEDTEEDNKNSKSLMIENGENTSDTTSMASTSDTTSMASTTTSSDNATAKKTTATDVNSSFSDDSSSSSSSDDDDSDRIPELAGVPLSF